MGNKSLLNQGTLLFHGKYKIQRYLSSGGFGNTYEAIDTAFNERVAIKELFVKGMCTREEGNTISTIEENKESFDSLLQKFKKESLRLRKIDHAHIVKVRDFFEENGTAYYVMDFVDGASLASVLKEAVKPLAEDKALDIFDKTLSALECIHANNIWHLDIKPGNIMIDKDFNPILIDFGASKQLQDAKGNAMSTSSSLVLTPGFAPIEQMEQNFDKFGPWTDFYALGATLYFCLTLRVPPMPSDIAENGSASLNMPKALSTKIQQLVVWLLEPSRTKRPQSVVEINEWMKSGIIKSANDSLETVVVEKKKEDKNSKGIPTAMSKGNKRNTIVISVLGIVIFVFAISALVYRSSSYSIDLGLSSMKFEVDSVIVDDIDTTCINPEIQAIYEIEKYSDSQPRSESAYFNNLNQLYTISRANNLFTMEKSDFVYLMQNSTGFRFLVYKKMENADITGLEDFCTFTKSIVPPREALTQLKRSQSVWNKYSNVKDLNLSYIELVDSQNKTLLVHKYELIDDAKCFLQKYTGYMIRVKNYSTKEEGYIPVNNISKAEDCGFRIFYHIQKFK